MRVVSIRQYNAHRCTVLVLHPKITHVISTSALLPDSSSRSERREEGGAVCKEETGTGGSKRELFGCGDPFDFAKIRTNSVALQHRIRPRSKMTR